MSGEGRFALVVVTRGRIRLAGRFLESLKRQRRRGFSVFLGHGRECAPEAAAFAEACAGIFPVTRLELPPCGVSAARNRLLRLALAEGEFLAFPDDDCEYLPDTLEEAARVFRSHPSAPGLLGRQVTAEKERFGGGVRALNRYTAISGSQTFLQFYRREAVEKLGGFDESLGPGTGLPFGSGEDTDYVLRALALGGPVLRAPAVRIRHPFVDFSDPGLEAKTASYARGRMRLLEKHGYPGWFRLANALEPLLMLPVDAFVHGKMAARWRWVMLKGRIVGL